MGIDTEGVYYLSGPITGRDSLAVMEHFSRVEQKLVEIGCTVINPIKNPHRNSWEEYMRDGITNLMLCDYIVLLDDWSMSRGAVIERNLAADLGIKVITEKDVMNGIH